MRTLLSAKGFPKNLLDAWESEGITTLLPLQVKALQQDCFGSKSMLLIGPTSCGKTFVGELICVQHALNMRSSFYLVPFKALAEEKYADFTKKYGAVGVRIAISTADRRDDDRRIVDGEFDIAILTYEKLSVLAVLHPAVLKRSGALVVDEIQMIADAGRGAELELLLTRARQIAPELQIIGLSAVVADLCGLDKWLEARVVEDSHRPVVLREGVISPSGKFEFVEWQASERKAGAESLQALSGDTSVGLAASLVCQLLTDPKQQILVFASSIADTQTLAQRIADAAPVPSPATSIKKALLGLESTENVRTLEKLLNKRVAFHNGDLTLDERLAVEKGFRQGDIRCIVSTSTLSMGVNLPASTVVIANSKKWTKDVVGGWQQVPLSVAEYRNMSGRAGRFGLLQDDFGRSVLIAMSPFEQQALLRSLVTAAAAPIESVLPKQPLGLLVLRILASRLCDNVNGCSRFFLRTLAARTEWGDNASRDQLESQIQELTKSLQEDHLVATNSGGRITVTDIGIVCASSGLRVESFQKLSQLVNSRNASLSDIALVASLCEDTGPEAVGFRFPTDEFRNRTSHYVGLIRSVSERGPLTEAALDQLEGSQPTYERAKALKYQALALAYASGVASQDIEDQFDVSIGRVRGLGSYCSWLCDVAAKMARLRGLSAESKAYGILGDRFQHGCSEAALFVAQVPQNLHRAERELLVAAGFTSLQKISDTASVEIARSAGVSRARVERLQKQIIAILGDSLEVERVQMSKLKAMGKPVGPIEMLYAAKGRALEQAIEDILTAPFCPFSVVRIALQREGEADLKFILSGGNFGIAQVTAKDNPADRVGIVKAGAVLQQSPELNPTVYICFGRPDFMDDAKRKAESHAKSGKNFKLIPISVLAEMYVRFQEGTLTSERVRDIFENETGYIGRNRI